MKMTIMCMGAALLAALAVAGPEVSIDFSREPVEKGARFDRRFVAPGDDGWVVTRGGDPQHSWMRHLPIEITDPAFKCGKMPIVEVEVEYWHEASSTFEVVVDTERGLVRGGSRWGGGKKWQTLKFNLEDAYLGSRGSLPKTGAFDLRLSAANGDWKIRRVRIAGVEMERNPDFSALLKVDGPNPIRRQVLYFTEDESIVLAYEFRNRARASFDGKTVVSLYARDGDRLLASNETIVKLSTGGGCKTKVSFPSLPTRLRRGIYDVVTELKDATGRVVRAQTDSLGVGSAGTLGKARPGEFRYGLDVKLGRCDQSPQLMEWMELMGVDIVRTGFDMNHPADAYDGVAALRKAGMDVLAVFDVPKDEDEGRFCDAMRRAGDFVEKVAAGLRPPFWELGNEPDLPFFFPAGIPRYLDGFHPLYSRIKDADSKTVVMNGGLANAGHRPESPRRVVEFMELFDTNRIDVIGYHAHGVGAKAERRARGKIAVAARAVGKGRFRLVDTETGMAAAGPEQEMKQAATCVQKFAFCQAQGDPFMIWFRLLFEHPSSYGSLYSPRSPRPVVLAYRNMVENLRGSRFTGTVHAPGDMSVCGCAYEHPDGRRLAVIWTDREEEASSVAVNLGSARDVIALDVFGNRKDEVAFSNGFYNVSVSFVPIYLSWKGGADVPNLLVRERASAGSPIDAMTWDTLPDVNKDGVSSEAVEIGESCVDNAFWAEPDTFRWWQGKDDLSAKLAVGVWQNRLVMRIDVRDDRHVSATSDVRGDNVKIGIADGVGKPIFKCSASLADAAAFKGDVDTSLSSVMRRGSETVYLLVGRKFPAEGAGRDGGAELSLDVYDDDGFGTKQCLRLMKPIRMAKPVFRP